MLRMNSQKTQQMTPQKWREPKRSENKKYFNFLQQVWHAYEYPYQGEFAVSSANWKYSNNLLHLFIDFPLLRIKPLAQPNATDSSKLSKHRYKF